MSNYRPKDWKNPWEETLALSPDKQTQYLLDNIYEAGASAVLEALKKSEGRHRILPQDNDYLSNLYPEQIGYLVFIPDEK